LESDLKFFKKRDLWSRREKKVEKREGVRKFQKWAAQKEKVLDAGRKDLSEKKRQIKENRSEGTGIGSNKGTLREAMEKVPSEKKTAELHQSEGNILRGEEKTGEKRL